MKEVTGIDLCIDVNNFDKKKVIHTDVKNFT